MPITFALTLSRFENETRTPLLILDDVLVREDVAGGVEHEPRALRDAVPVVVITETTPRASAL